MIAVADQFRMRLARADTLRDDGKLDDALREYKLIVAEFPDEAEARFKLGTAHGRLLQAGDAERCYREAISLRGDYPEANNNLGLLVQAGGDLDAAERLFRVALAERPDYLEAHLNLAGLLHETTRLLEAQYYAKRALLLKPDCSEAYARLGQATRSMGRTSQAIRDYQRAVELDPKSASALTDLGSCYWQCGRHDEAEGVLKGALAVTPGFFPAWNNLLLISNYRSGDREDVFRLHRSFGEIVREQCGGEAKQPATVRPDPNRRLRIGFISGDFRRHSVACFLPGPLANLDRRRFQLFAYYNFRTEDKVTQELKPLFHQWKSIYGISDIEVAELIRRDRIDVLIDLAGHTASIRPWVLGRRPAPIQVHWIGYPNTTGLDCIDYRLTDAWVDPVEQENAFSTEILWRLPQSFLCFSPAETAPPVQDPPSLTRGDVTFGSFNSRAKLSDECLAMWCRILHALPDSRLVLKSMFGVDDAEARTSLQQLFVAHGIDAERIEIRVRLGVFEDHLSAYSDIDVALDTFPYNGTTTTCEALWMGVPVVSLAGDRHASRVGASLLNNAGLGNLVAGDPDEFVRIAIALASDTGALKAARESMRDQLRDSRLTDKVAIGEELGAALREMWRRHCAGFSAALPAETAGRNEEPELIKLHIGGREARAGWKILDAVDRPEVDFVGDLTNLDSIADESCSDVYCSHVLEHVSQSEILGVLNSLYRILVPGGRLYVAVPDMEMLAWLFVSPEYDKAERFQIMRRMFGGQTDEFDFHQIGLFFDLLQDYLNDVGFASLEHVESFGLFEDTNMATWDGHLISLNLIAIK